MQVRPGRRGSSRRREPGRCRPHPQQGADVAINHCGTAEAALETKRLIEVFACRASRGAPYITGQATFACGDVILFADFLTDWPSPPS
jgi:hypothetical protein